MNIKNKCLFVLILPVITLLAYGSASVTAKQNLITTREATAILQELKQIRSVLERIEKKTANGAVAEQNRPAQPRVAKISSVNRPSLGNKDAPVTIVVVSDYQCPFCKRFVDSTMPDLKKNYIDTGKVRLVFKDMPLPFHDKARKVAQAAHCAGEQGKYWKMHDKLFADIKKYEDIDLINRAKILTLNVDKFKGCIASQRYIDAIEKDMADAGKAGISGTPSFVIGKTTGDIIKGDVVVGAMPLSGLKKYIDKLL